MRVLESRHFTVSLGSHTKSTNGVFRRQSFQSGRSSTCASLLMHDPRAQLLNVLMGLVVYGGGWGAIVAFSLPSKRRQTTTLRIIIARRLALKARRRPIFIVVMFGKLWFMFPHLSLHSVGMCSALGYGPND